LLGAAFLCPFGIFNLKVFHIELRFLVGYQFVIIALKNSNFPAKSFLKPLFFSNIAIFSMLEVVSQTVNYLLVFNLNYLLVATDILSTYVNYRPTCTSLSIIWPVSIPVISQ